MSKNRVGYLAGRGSGAVVVGGCFLGGHPDAWIGVDPALISLIVFTVFAAYLPADGADSGVILHLLLEPWGG